MMVGSAQQQGCKRPAQPALMCLRSVPFRSFTPKATHLELRNSIHSQSRLACLRVSIPVLHDIVKPAGVAMQQAAQHWSATVAAQSSNKAAANLAGLPLLGGGWECTLHVDMPATTTLAFCGKSDVPVAASA
jgi:hypothetical protein